MITPRYDGVRRSSAENAEIPRAAKTGPVNFPIRPFYGIHTREVSEIISYLVVIDVDAHTTMSLKVDL